METETTTLLINLSNLTCRTCLKDYENSNSLYDEMEYDDGRMELKEALQTTTNIEISVNEMIMPTRICFDCTEKLISAFEFIRSTQKSEKLLQECCSEEEIKDGEILKISRAEKETSSARQDSEEESQELEILDDQFEMLLDDDVGDDVDNCNLETSTLKVKQSVIAQQIQLIDQTEDARDTTKKPHKDMPPPSSTTSSTSNRGSNMRFTIGSRLGYETSKWHRCKDCPRSFAKEETLVKHVKAAHTYASAECIKALAPKPTKEQPFQCPICPRTFSRKDTLQRHTVAMHTAESSAQSDQHDDIAEKKQKYKRGLCPHCGRSFSQASLIIHIRRHTGEKPYKCDQCEKGFPRRQDLVIHQRQHTGEKPHVCTLCGKSFIRPNKLSRHMRVHTGSRPYKCEKCEKSFSQSNDLRIHMRRHTGEKPYTCSVCNEGFICGSALKAHRKSKSHFNPDDADPDPYANCRVNNRSNTNLAPPAEKQSLKHESSCGEQE